MNTPDLRKLHNSLPKNLTGAIGESYFLEREGKDPVALIEYKTAGYGHIDFSAPSRMSWRELVRRAKIPYFVVLFSPNFESFEVYPVGGLARKVISTNQILNRHQFIKFQYSLRGISLSEKDLDSIALQTAEAHHENR